jgi:uncharacterized protein (DUF302 family)
MVVLRHDASGLVVGLNQHRDSPDGPFDERRAGLDHVGFAVGRREDLDAWEERLTTLGVEHSPVADTEAGSALVFRDPDHIQLELWWSKSAAGERPLTTRARGVVERSSPLRVEATVQRLVEAATAAGATVFAIIDHAAGARSVGFEMPDTQVLIVGNPAVGTPAMLAAPDLALELPTRILVRAASPGHPGSMVLIADPVAVAQRYGLGHEVAAGLASVVGLVDRALDAASDGEGEPAR